MEENYTNIKERVLFYAKSQGVSIELFLSSIGMTYGSFKGKAKKGALNSDAIAEILTRYPNVNPSWLLTGEGEMLNDGAKEDKLASLYINDEMTEGVPYWNLQVSAGHSVTEVIGQSKPDGYIQGLPGADIAENILPVLGASMEPEVSNGAIIGVRAINNWESLNTERIYMIITKDDRMIKRIEYDQENEDILWCVSPNYPKFKIFKADIVEIQRVCFVYNPK